MTTPIERLKARLHAAVSKARAPFDATHNPDAAEFGLLQAPYPHGWVDRVVAHCEAGVIATNTAVLAGSTSPPALPDYNIAIVTLPLRALVAHADWLVCIHEGSPPRTGNDVAGWDLLAAVQVLETADAYGLAFVHAEPVIYWAPGGEPCGIVWVAWPTGGLAHLVGGVVDRMDKWVGDAEANAKAAKAAADKLLWGRKRGVADWYQWREDSPPPRLHVDPLEIHRVCASLPRGRPTPAKTTGWMAEALASWCVGYEAALQEARRIRGVLPRLHRELCEVLAKKLGECGLPRTAEDVENMGIHAAGALLRQQEGKQ